MVREALGRRPQPAAGAGLQAVLFDFDFTLGDSSVGVVECVGFALAEAGRPVPPREKILATIGLSLQRSFHELTGDTGAGAVEAFVSSFHAHADNVIEAATVVYPPVVPVLDDLRRRGLRTAIVTTKLRRRIAGILARNGLRDAFDVLVGAEDVAACKPDPAGILLALARLRVAPDAAVYVGDHVVDGEAASAAGVRFVATSTGTCSRADLARGPHAAIIDGIGDLPQALSLEP